jgi:response regulator RpfG family c-di-GMP phosphodiesterase
MDFISNFPVKAFRATSEAAGRQFYDSISLDIVVAGDSCSEALTNGKRVQPNTARLLVTKHLHRASDAHHTFFAPLDLYVFEKWLLESVQGRPEHDRAVAQ